MLTDAKANKEVKEANSELCEAAEYYVACKKFGVLAGQRKTRQQLYLVQNAFEEGCLLLNPMEIIMYRRDFMLTTAASLAVI
jgi:hypothetical protein